MSRKTTDTIIGAVAIVAVFLLLFICAHLGASKIEDHRNLCVTTDC